ncbi:MAG: hypothetical protein AMJ65_05645 [Phycisphaerae bacterium SG8_4]|nr:MAG: hypothetical protein AMJ65_05645 [Phycisphaerae bacterium SG8_4]
MKPNTLLSLVLVFTLLGPSCRKKPEASKTSFAPLLKAARTGDIEGLRALVAAGADINERDEWGNPALHILAERDDPNAAKALIAAGADIEARNSEGDTPLIKAAMRFREQMAAALIAAGADVDAQGLFLNTPLHWAAERGCGPLVQLLIDSGAHVDSRNRRGETPAILARNSGQRAIVELLISEGAHVTLQTAAYLGDLEKVRSLILEDAMVDGETAEGQTALHFAAAQDHKDVADLLLANGGDPNFRRRVDGAMPLHLATEVGHRTMVELLLDNGADVNARYDKVNVSPLQIAASHGDKDMATLFIAHGANVNAKGEDSGWYMSDWTPLRYAVESGSRELVRLLIDNGANPNETDRYGRSMVAIAMGKDDRESIELLLAAGVDVTIHLAVFVGDADTTRSLINEGGKVNLLDDRGYAPLHYAAKTGNRALAELLIAEGAEIDIKSLKYSEDPNASPLYVAVYYGNPEIVRLLISAGADLAERDEGDSTLLHLAACMGHKNIVEMLLAAGAQVDAEDWQQRTPLYSASRAGRPDIVELLLANGADVTAGYVGIEVVLPDKASRNPREIAEQLVTRFGPHSVIISDTQSVRQYLRYEGGLFDELWIPERKDLEGIDPILTAHLESGPLIAVMEEFDRKLVLRHLHLYNREYSGFTHDGVRHIVCQMIIHDLYEGKPPSAFTMIHGSGSGVIRFVYNTVSKTIDYIDCEFPY